MEGEGGGEDSSKRDVLFHIALVCELFTAVWALI